MVNLPDLGGGARGIEALFDHAPAGCAERMAEPEIYYLSGRAPATRFIYDYPLDRLPGARDEALRALQTIAPSIIITYHGVEPAGFQPLRVAYDYHLQATIAGYDIYERR